MNDFLSPVYSGKSPPLSTYTGSPNSSSGMLGSIISGVGSLANGVINAIQSNKNNKRQIEFAKWSQQQQERFAWDMFRAENRYNDPSAQAERLLRAGLNPALMYGSGVGSTGEASGGQTLSAVQPNTSPVPSFLQNLVGSNPFQSLSALLEAEKVKADVKKTGAETKNIDQATINAQIDEQLGKLSLQKEQAAQPYFGKVAYNDLMKRINENEVLVNTASNLAKQGKLFEAQEKMNDALTDWYKIQKDYKEAQLPQAYNEIVSIINSNNSTARRNTAEANQINELTPILKKINKMEFNKGLRDIRGKEISNRSDAIDLLRKTLNVDQNAINNLMRRFDNLVNKGTYQNNADDLADFLNDVYHGDLDY